MDAISAAVSSLSRFLFGALPGWLQVFALLVVVLIVGEILARLIGFFGRLVQVIMVVIVALAFMRLIGA